MKAVGPVVAELEKRIALTLFGNDAKTELGFLRQDVQSPDSPDRCAYRYGPGVHRSYRC